MDTNQLVAKTEAALRRGGLPLSQLSGEPGALAVRGGEEAAAWDWYRAARVEATARGAMKFYGSKPEVQS